jgi:cyclopropane fatty-acyl-phospholipid synthase-like methyltransferase
MTFFKNLRIRRHVATVDQHYTVLNNRYLKIYGEILDASRTKNPEELLAYLASEAGIKNGMKLLDAGCGVGGPARYFASHFDINIQGITATKLQAEIARQKNAEAGLDKRIEIINGDFHFLSKHYPENNFDIVYFFESFCHGYDIKQVMNEVHKVLKPGGVLYMKDCFLTDRLKKRDKALYEVTLKRINEFYSFNLTEGLNELSSVENYLNTHGFNVKFGRTPGYTTDGYEVASLFHGHNEKYGRNDELMENTLIGEISDVFDVIEIFELKAVKQ